MTVTDSEALAQQFVLYSVVFVWGFGLFQESPWKIWFNFFVNGEINLSKKYKCKRLLLY